MSIHPVIGSDGEGSVWKEEGREGGGREGRRGDGGREREKEGGEEEAEGG